MPESGQKERSVKPSATACVGSNPTSPTIRDAYGIAMCVFFLYTEKGNLYVVKTSACFVLFFLDNMEKEIIMKPFNLDGKRNLLRWVLNYAKTGKHHNYSCPCRNISRR